MKDLIINVSRETRMVDLSKTIIGVDNENLQQNLVFRFKDEFVNGVARLEFVIDNEKQFAMLTKSGESYSIPVKNILTKRNYNGQTMMQLVITESEREEGIPVFKSNVFYVAIKESINAESEAPDGYQQWLEIANAKLAELDDAIESTERLNISALKIGDTTTIEITKKDGSSQFAEIKDGEPGKDGEKGERGNDALINGKNTIEILAGKNVDLEQFDDKLVINSIGGGSEPYDDTKVWEAIGEHDKELQNIENDIDEIQTDIDDMGATLDNLDTNKQDKLTAGANIKIENNVISATGGGTGGGAVDSVNGKTGTVELNAEDVGALPNTTVIPDYYVNVKDFGAIGDGIADDTDFIQNAIDSIQETGGTVFFPVGIYNLAHVKYDVTTSGTAHAIRVYSNQRLLFEPGATLKRGASEVTHMLFTYNDTTASGYTGAENIEIIGATIDGNSPAIAGNNTALNISHSTNVKIKDCILKNIGTNWHAIEINSSLDTVIDGCIFENNTNIEDIQLDMASGSGNIGTSDRTVCKDTVIKNCVFNMKRGCAIGNHSDAEHTNTKIFNNVFKGTPDASRGYINTVAKHKNIEIFNNMFYDANIGIVINRVDKDSLVHDNRFQRVITPYSGGLYDYYNYINGNLEVGYGATPGGEDYTHYKIPDNYTQVKYLEATGTQYIDTNFIPKLTTKITINNWERTAGGERYQIYMGCNTADNSNDGVNVREYATNNRLDFARSNKLLGANGYAITKAEKIIVEGNTINADGTSKSIQAGGTDSVLPLFLFAGNLGGTAWRNSNCRLGVVEFEENGEIVSRLVPCLDNNKVPCYYDETRKTTHYNLGSDLFMYKEYQTGGIPTKLSQLKNDTGFITADDVPPIVKTVMCHGVGAEWTDEEKTAAQERIGIYSSKGVGF